MSALSGDDAPRQTVHGDCHDRVTPSRAAGQPLRQGPGSAERAPTETGQKGSGRTKDPDKVGQAGNGKVNTSNQGYQHDR
ncbi:hypothetical protein LRS73_13145 [Methylobacterium currus]|uniref:hypothetical protein n=1 Tax=Methylobacterium currus TaxID=2051553 RepID=UPI001E50D015|nr:hypothetical protein [Methylobacterium currus]UHC18707.1 hypothetical protein LRS73_13145 [Methylobacterium currus]